MKFKSLFLGCVLSVPFVPTLFAADAEKTNAAPAAKKDDAKLAPVVADATRKPSVVTNTVTIAGQPITYTVETGMLPLLKTDGAPRASVFYIAYTKMGATNPATRPVMFCFNGGPGS